jgi:hypothetical protein
MPRCTVLQDREMFEEQVEETLNYKARDFLKSILMGTINEVSLKLTTKASKFST